MKSLRCAAIILSACVCAFGIQGQEEPVPPVPPTPPAVPAKPAPLPPSADRDRRDLEREIGRVEREKDRAKAEVERAKADMERAMAGAKAQARVGGGGGGGGGFGGGFGGGGTFMKVIGKTEPAAYVGVSTSPVTAALSEQLKLPKGIGLIVDYVEPKSPAEEAQLKQYDVLHRFDDQLLINAHQFAVLVRMHKAGEEVTLTVIRRGEERPVKVKLVEREVMALDATNPWGMPGFNYSEGGGGGGFGGGFSSGGGFGGGGSFRPVKVGPPEHPMPNKTPGAATQPGAKAVPGSERMAYVNQMFSADSGGGREEQSEVRLSDPQGTLILQKSGIGQRLIVANPEGKWLSTYQLNDPGQLKALPADVSARYERLLKAYRRVSERGDADVTPEKPEKAEKPAKPQALPTPTPGTN